MYSKIPRKLCWTHFVPEGCLKKESYLYKFWREFWKGNYSENELDTDGYAEEHYQKSPDKYVTEYAATNPAEDFAESFMFFIAEDNYGNKKIAGKKVDFFRQYPEFRKAKNEILHNFKSILE
jgi:Mlc titration factor MtfA (ptsG expression regulator)